MRRAGRALVRAAVVLVAIGVGPVDAAFAAPPSVSITSPVNGSISNDETPVFAGVGEEAAGEVSLRIYPGTSAAGAPAQEMSTLLFSLGGRWTLGPAEELKDGTYTAQARQTNLAAETGVSTPVTFTVDTGPPKVTLNPPPAPADDTTPWFTGSASDTTPVTIQIHAGATAKGAVVSTAAATGTGGAWTSGTASPSLSNEQYTAVAIQPSSLAGNPAGRSEPVTFTVSPPPVIVPALLPPPAPPSASFNWFPTLPVAGEPVLLMSNSTDPGSQITATAWALAATAPFQGGGAVLITSFSAPGSHVVRLRVTNAYGLSSVSSATIEVLSPKPSLMQPFPVVRIVGTETASGVKLRLLRVQQAPAGARITVRCSGRGCPLKLARAQTVASRRGVSPIDFRGFERALDFGLTLEILVSKPGEIGKYTRFAIRRGKLPERVDSCLDLAGVKPMACPQS